MSENDHSKSRIGSVLRGKWTLEKLLGEGGMAAVYVGVHKIGRRDAIKILHPHVAKIPDVQARFEQEAHAVNRFHHPGAVEIRDIDVTEDGEPFLVMELLEGEPLAQVIRRDGAMPAERVLAWTDELLDVLASAHAQGIVHRDIKPDNLFVLTDGRLKVLDFGIARVRSGASKGMKTLTGQTLGTVSYMAPEQARGQEIDHRADIYAVGATMFRALVNRRVHEAESDFERLKKVAAEAAQPLGEIAPGLPRDVCAIVDRALAFDREERYPAAARMQDDVRAVRRGEAPRFARATHGGREPATVGPKGLLVAAFAPTTATLEPTRVSLPTATPPIGEPAPSPSPSPSPIEAPTQVVVYDAQTEVEATQLSAGGRAERRGSRAVWLLTGGACVLLAAASLGVCAILRPRASSVPEATTGSVVADAPAVSSSPPDSDTMAASTVAPSAAPVPCASAARSAKAAPTVAPAASTRTILPPTTSTTTATPSASTATGPTTPPPTATAAPPTASAAPTSPVTASATNPPPPKGHAKKP